MTQITMDQAIRKFRQPQYDLSCSEATIHAANEVYSLNLDPNALKMMAGFSGGLMCEDLCGVISASVAALGVIFAESVAHQSPTLKLAVKEYLTQADHLFKSRLCCDIKKNHRDLENNTCDPVIFSNAHILDEIVRRYK